MTDNLVKRLRIAADRADTVFDPDFASPWREAADRIESQLKLIDASGKVHASMLARIEELEAALREISLLHYDSEKDFYQDAMKAHHIAVAALGEKKDDRL